PVGGNQIRVRDIVGSEHVLADRRTDPQFARAIETRQVVSQPVGLVRRIIKVPVPEKPRAVGEMPVGVDDPVIVQLDAPVAGARDIGCRQRGH
ncbi:MAG: hypothetical protein VW644_07920, partial [Alphaproteobacteria bacterium]